MTKNVLRFNETNFPHYKLSYFPPNVTAVLCSMIVTNVFVSEFKWIRITINIDNKVWKERRSCFLSHLQGGQIASRNFRNSKVE